MTKKIGWEHVIDSSNTYAGINDAGIETFRGDPVNGFAREGVQNSYDAAVSKSGGDHKVKIILDHVDIATDSIPGIGELKENILLAQDTSHKKYPDNRDQRNDQFYRKAIDLLDQDSIPVFQLTDLNTTGMEYTPGEMNNKFYKFVKSSGVSGKQGSDGGSYGIGKNASFAVSDLRTIFVSTAFNKDGNRQEISQGKCVLSSLVTNEGLRSHIGYWGEKDGCEPVVTDEQVPEWAQFNNDQTTGTKLSILGFSSYHLEDWKEKMSLSILSSFFAPIIKEKLEIQLGNDSSALIWNKRTISNFLPQLRNKIYEIGMMGSRTSTEMYDELLSYISLYDEQEAIDSYEEPVSGLGLCSLKVKVSEGLSKKVCFLRDGIKITDNLQVEGLKSFTGLKDFVAIFECLDPKGNSLLRSMEDPKHSDFDAPRAGNPQEVALAQTALKNIGVWVREKLNESCKITPLKERVIDSMLQYLWYEDEGMSDDDGKDEINPFTPGRVILPAVEPRKKPISPTTENPTDPPGPPKPPSPPRPPKPRPVGPRPNPKKIGKEVEIANPRVVRISDKQISLTFNVEFDGEIGLNFLVAGEDFDDRIFPEKINGTKVKSNFMIEVRSNERTKIEVEFKENFDSALITKAYEISE